MYLGYTSGYLDSTLATVLGQGIIVLTEHQERRVLGQDAEGRAALRIRVRCNVPGRALGPTPGAPETPGTDRLGPYLHSLRSVVPSAASVRRGLDQ
jgi:hypothetical protein